MGRRTREIAATLVRAAATNQPVHVEYRDGERRFAGMSYVVQVRPLVLQPVTAGRGARVTVGDLVLFADGSIVAMHDVVRIESMVTA